MKRFSLLLAAASLLLPALNGVAAIHNVRDYGAVGDGRTIDSPAINAAIQAAARDGGGTVLIPAGTYASYSIRLESHICLKLEQGAVLLAAKPENGEGYDEAEPCPWDAYQDFGHSHWKNSLIWGIGLEDVSIVGPGKIDGSGLSDGFDLGKRTKIDADFDLPPHQGNKAVSLKECRGVRLSGLTLYRCGHFALLATGVDNLFLTDLVIDSNRDGLDIDCCRNVVVRGCLVNTPWDDGIVLKATYALGQYRDTENVSISDCYVSGYEVGSLLDGNPRPPVGVGRHAKRPLYIRSAGRIKFGTESSGGFRNIAITNCTLEYSGGLMLESMDGGDLEDVVISNLTMRKVVAAPISCVSAPGCAVPKDGRSGTCGACASATSTSTTPTPTTASSSPACRVTASRTCRCATSTWASGAGLRRPMRSRRFRKAKNSIPTHGCSAVSCRQRDSSCATWTGWKPTGCISPSCRPTPGPSSCVKTPAIWSSAT